MHEAQETSSFTTATSTIQGVCTDGSNIFATDTGHIYKLSMSGTLIASVSTDSHGTVHHVGDISIKDGVLHIETSNWQSTPAVGYVQKYNASDLSYIGEVQTYSGKYGAGLTWDGNNFWTGDGDTNFKKWASDFSSYVAVASDHLPPQPQGWQGLTWINGDLYANSHEGALPQTLRKFSYDGTSLTLEEHLPHPYACTQGIDYHDSVLYMARRETSNEGIVLCEIVPYDFRNQNLVEEYDLTERWTDSTSYVDQTSLTTTPLPVKKDDLVKVTLAGIYRNSTGSLRAYINPTATGSVALEKVGDAPSVRTDCTNSEGNTIEISKLYRVLEDGDAKFIMRWQKNSSGRAYVSQRNLYAQVIGKAVVL